MHIFERGIFFDLLHWDFYHLIVSVNFIFSTVVSPCILRLVQAYDLFEFLDVLCYLSHSTHCSHQIRVNLNQHSKKSFLKFCFQVVCFILTYEFLFLKCCFIFLSLIKFSVIFVFDYTFQWLAWERLWWLVTEQRFSLSFMTRLYFILKES